MISQEWINKMTESKYHKSEASYEPAIRFAVDVGQCRQLGEWLDEHIKVCPFTPTEENPFPGGAIGGVMTYSFTNTSIGQICKATCACGGEVDLTDYGDW